MSTRGIIARPNGDGFAGRYQHSDSYPTGLGVYLFRVVNQEFGGDVDAFLKYAIDEHPSGWSSFFGPERKCYCHSFPARKDYEDIGDELYTEANDVGQWAYVFTDNGAMAVFTNNTYDSWTPVALVPLNGPEPNWQTIECGGKLERCFHYKHVHDNTVCSSCDGEGVNVTGGHNVEAFKRMAKEGIFMPSCTTHCVPASRTPKAVQEKLRAAGTPIKGWHVYKPRDGFVCQTCGGTGKAPAGQKPYYERPEDAWAWVTNLLASV